MNSEYWKLDLNDEYVEIWKEGDQVAAKDARHELSCWGDSEEEAIETLQEALKEFLVLKFIRETEPDGIREIEEGLSMGLRDLAFPIGSLLQRGKVREKEKGKLRVVPE